MRSLRMNPSYLFDHGVVLDLGKRVVEVMQERAPALVRRRLAKALGVALERVPPHEQEVAIRFLDTASQLVALIPGRRGDDPLRLAEGGFEFGALTRADVQDGDFEDHAKQRVVPGSPSVTRKEPPTPTAITPRRSGFRGFQPPPRIRYDPGPPGAPGALARSPP